MSVWQVRIWPWTKMHGHRIGIRRWRQSYRMTRALHRNPAYVAAIEQADAEMARLRASGEEPVGISAAEMIARLRAERP